MKLAILIASSVSFFFTGYDTQKTKSKPAEEPVANHYVADDPCQEGDDEDPQPILSGAIRDNTVFSNPIYHACVEVRTTGYVLVSTIGSDINGHYYFNSLANGSYYLVVSASGFTTQSIPFTVSGSSQTLNVTMY